MGLPQNRPAMNAVRTRLEWLVEEKPMRISINGTPVATMFLTGVAMIIAGGLVAAVADPLEVARGSWLAAYLVLPGGVATSAMALARTGHVDPVRRDRGAWPQFALWFGGHAGVVGGTLAEMPLLVGAASILLVAALVLALRASVGIAAPVAAAWAYRALLVLLMLSIPVGIALSIARHG